MEVGGLLSVLLSYVLVTLYKRLLFLTKISDSIKSQNLHKKRVFCFVARDDNRISAQICHREHRERRPEAANENKTSTVSQGKSS